MKKQYETPVVEKIEFCYRDQVVASGNGCVGHYINAIPGNCESEGQDWTQTVN